MGSLVCTGIPAVSHWDGKEKTLVISAQTKNEASVHAYNLKQCVAQSGQSSPFGAEGSQVQILAH